MSRIAVLIPCYNESKTIQKVVCEWKNYLPEAEVYVYDNNSTDGTDRLAVEAGAVVRYEYQLGKGNVVRRMFQEVEADCYILIDGDDTYPVESAKEMIFKVLNRQADMVVGDRLSSTYFTENKRPFHNFGNSLVRKVINFIFKSNVMDIMTGYRAFSYRFVKTFPVVSKGFEIETEMTIHAISMNMSIENVVVDYRDRPVGSESKLSTVKDGIRVMLTIFNLFRNYRPLSFFTILAGLLITLDMCVFIPTVLFPYYQTGVVMRFPTLIVCGFVALAAVIAVFTGMILDAIRMKERREFEFRLLLLGVKKEQNRGKCI